MIENNTSGDVIVTATQNHLQEIGIDLQGDRSVSEEHISEGLRSITDRLEEMGVEPADNNLGGVFVYGTYYENEIFGIHPHCSCERDSCTRCLRCTCPDASFTYRINSEEVDAETFFGIDVEKFMTADTTVIKDQTHTCGLCSGESIPAPNFWHKSSGTKISWFVAIGRTMKIDLQGEWEEILLECLTSIQSNEIEN